MPTPRLATRLARPLAAIACVLAACAPWSNPVARADESAASSPPAATDQAAQAQALSLIEQIDSYTGSGVVSVWLANGLRIHAKQLDTDAVHVSVLFPGGALLEDASTRSISRAAMAAWTLDSVAQIQLPTGLTIGQAYDLSAIAVEGHATGDAFRLDAKGPPGSLDTLLAIVRAATDQPIIPSQQFYQHWLDQQADLLEHTRTKPAGVVSSILMNQVARTEHDARLQLPTAADITRHDRADAEQWLRDHIAEAPAELAVLGSVDPAQAIRATAQAFASRETCERIGPAALDALRPVETSPTPITYASTEPLTDSRVHFVLGFPGVDLTQIREHRALMLGMGLVYDRVMATAHDQQIDLQGVLAASIPAVTRPGIGMTLIAGSVPTEADAQRLLQIARAAILDVAHARFDHARFATLRTQLADRAAANTSHPAFWQERLPQSTYRGVSPDEGFCMAQAYRTLTPDEVVSVWALRATPDNFVRIILTPEEPGTE